MNWYNQYEVICGLMLGSLHSVLRIQPVTFYGGYIKEINHLFGFKRSHIINYNSYTQNWLN